MWKRVIFLISFWSASSFADESADPLDLQFYPNCTNAIPQDPILLRIFGGQEASPHSYNWMVIMVIDRVRFNGKISKSVCGGNIITSTKVLTAAHCTNGAKAIRIYYGLHSLSQA